MKVAYNVSGLMSFVVLHFVIKVKLHKEKRKDNLRLFVCKTFTEGFEDFPLLLNDFT